MHRVRDLLQECPTLSRNSTAIDVEWTTRFNSELSTLFNISRRTGCICVTAVDRIDLILHYRCTFCRQFYDRVYCNYQLCCRLTIKYISWRPMIYFAFVNSHLLYGVEVYANTTTNHLSKLMSELDICRHRKIDRASCIKARKTLIWKGLLKYAKDLDETYRVPTRLHDECVPTDGQ